MLTGSDPEEEELIKNVAGIAFAGEYHFLSLWTAGADVRRSFSKRARTL